jgi:hypothetical protein
MAGLGIGEKDAAGRMKGSGFREILQAGIGLAGKVNRSKNLSAGGLPESETDSHGQPQCSKATHVFVPF